MILLVLKTLIYVFFMWLYIVNNAQIEWIAHRINREIIRPYSSQFEIMYVTPTPEVSPKRSLSPTRPIATVPLTSPSKPTPIVITATPVPSYVTEGDLWAALTSYRNTHNKPTINKSDVLCQYARTRAQELTDRLKSDPENPLDAHAGFIRDADSGYIFDLTGYSYVGENLAYLPTVTSATQVIEWGWDSSATHRSLQLSADITNGCIAVIHPIYVGIYSY